MSDTRMTLPGDRRMTVKEVADALGTAESTIRNKAAELFPEIVRNGVATYLNESQVTILKQALVPRNLTLKSKVDSATTDLEMIEQGARFTVWALAKLKEQADRIADLEPKAAVADRITAASGLKPLRTFGEIIGIGKNRIFKALEAAGFIYKDHASDEWIPKAGLERYLVLREQPYQRGTEWHTYSRLYVTGEGETWLAKKLQLDLTAGQAVEMRKALEETMG